MNAKGEQRRSRDRLRGGNCGSRPGSHPRCSCRCRVRRFTARRSVSRLPSVRLPSVEQTTSARWFRFPPATARIATGRRRELTHCEHGRASVAVLVIVSGRPQGVPRRGWREGIGWATSINPLRARLGRQADQRMCSVRPLGWRLRQDRPAARVALLNARCSPRATQSPFMVAATALSFARPWPSSRPT